MRLGASVYLIADSQQVKEEEDSCISMALQDWAGGPFRMNMIVSEISEV